MAGAFRSEKPNEREGEMAIALFATFVNQTPLFGNGAAGLVGRRKTLGKNNRVMDADGVVSPTGVRQPGALFASLERGRSFPA